MCKVVQFRENRDTRHQRITLKPGAITSSSKQTFSIPLELSSSCKAVTAAEFPGTLQENTHIINFILLHEKFLQFDWLRAMVFQLNLKYPHVKITNLLRVVV